MFNGYNANLGASLTYYPFLTANNVNPTTPFLNSQNLNSNNGPFKFTSVTVRSPDICNVRFLNTMNDLTSSGKLISSVFYEQISDTWTLPVTTANCTFTASQLLNNIGYTRQFTMT